jgi:hypothetical protein
MAKTYIINKELLEAIEALEIAELLNDGNKLQLEYNDKTGELKVLRCYVKKVNCQKMGVEG